MSRYPLQELTVDAAYRRLQADFQQRRVVCPSCRGNGGWQRADGLIVECPRGCMTADGPRCVTCGETEVDNDNEMCDQCGDNPHQFVHDGSRHDFCACGRIRAIAGYSPFHIDERGAA